LHLLAREYKNKIQYWNSNNYKKVHTTAAILLLLIESEFFGNSTALHCTALQQQ